MMESVLTEPDLIAWGERIGRDLPTRAGAVLALRGDLGAGKSTLARAIARGAGVEGSVPSPTFNLVFHYETRRGRIVHLDLYRLERPEDVWPLGWSELPEPGDLVLIEWPDRAEELLPEPRWEIEILDEGSDETRRVRATAVGAAPPLPEPEVSEVTHDD